MIEDYPLIPGGINAIQRTYDKVKDQKRGRTYLFEAHDAPWSLEFKRHEDHGLEHNYRII